jgi:hypothetical protein
VGRNSTGNNFVKGSTSNPHGTLIAVKLGDIPMRNISFCSLVDEDPNKFIEQRKKLEKMEGKLAYRETPLVQTSAYNYNGKEP